MSAFHDETADLEVLWRKEVRRVPDLELSAEQEYASRMLIALTGSSDYTEDMVPAEQWAALFAGRVGFISAELDRRRRLGVYKRSEMSSIPITFIEGVKHDIRLEEFIVERHPDTRLKSCGASFMGRCPWHADDTPSLHVWQRPDAHWYCFSCQEGGDVYSWLLKRDALSFREAVEQAARYLGRAIPAVGLELLRL